MSSRGQSRPRFRTREKPAGAPQDPERLFGELPRTPEGVGALWSHQADLLRTYNADHRATADVALELPTGSGKTLVGLLIADWRRRTLAQRVVYACPTNQLARQVQRAALAQSIPVVALIGSHNQWDDRDVSRYTGGEAVAVSTYSHIFNTNSYLADAQTLVFDDAHAAEGYVADAWSLSIGWEDAAYAGVLDAVRADLDPHLAARMTDESAETGPRGDMWLLPISVINRRVEEIDRALSTGLGDSQTFRFQMIRPGLRSCLFYLAPDGWYIRPYIPPTFNHGPFSDPIQRVYLSATLGEAGELERAFGRAPIARVPAPPAWERTGSGRRFFVFPDLALPPASEITGPGGLVGALLGLRKKRLVLTPDNRAAEKIANGLEIPSAERFTARDAGTGLQPFLDASRGTLLAPNRYDGMDLPGDSCRIMLLAGLPSASHLQDRFLATKLRAGNVILERIRTRVMQGAGRCTRGPKDYAVIVVQGSDLLRFLSRLDVRNAMPAELQAEIGFGLHTSRVPADDLVLLAGSAMDQDEVWQEDAEPDIAERRRDAVKAPPVDAANLGESAPREVRAWQAAWQQIWDLAGMTAADVLEHLTGSDLRPYRALWAYLGSAWFALAADQAVPGAAERSAELLRIAHQAAVGMPWLREVQPLPVADSASNPIDDDAVKAVLMALDGSLKSATKFDKIASQMLAALAKPDASGYEQALVTLGKLLGAESSKPSGKGRADAVWVWPSLWITIEAKSEQMTSGTLSMDYVRQANTHLDSLRADLDGEPPAGSASVVVSPRTIVDPDAVPIATQHLHLVHPSVVLGIASGAVSAWKHIRMAVPRTTDGDPRPTVAKALWDHQALPTQVLDRLTADPVRGT
ncbi:MAG: DEAD/DEAH box helicase [Micromonosporaceae bacterium]